MSRKYWRAANLLNPVPVVLVSCSDGKGHDNVMTAAWAGTVCSDPVMVSVSIRKNRYSHDLIQESGEFVLNLVNRDLVKATDYVGIYSGKKVDKFALEGDLKLTKEDSYYVKAPSIKESPLTLECKVHSILELGSHDMFIGEVVATGVDESLVDENNRLDLHKADLVCYSHGEYRALGKLMGTFGFSAKKEGRAASRTSVKKERSAKETVDVQEEKPARKYTKKADKDFSKKTDGATKRVRYDDKPSRKKGERKSKERVEAGTSEKRATASTKRYDRKPSEKRYEKKATEKRYDKKASGSYDKKNDFKRSASKTNSTRRSDSKRSNAKSTATKRTTSTTKRTYGKKASS